MRQGVATAAAGLLLAIVSACSSTDGATAPPDSNPPVTTAAPATGATTTAASPPTTSPARPETTGFSFVQTVEDNDQRLLEISYPILDHPNATQVAPINENIKQAIAEMQADFAAAARTAPAGESRSTFSMQAAPELINDQVFSVSGISFEFVRGGTATSTRVAWIFSLESGRQLSAADLFIDGDIEPLAAAARAHLIADVLGDAAAITVPDGLLASPENYDAVWLTATGIGVGFDQFQVTGGDAGTPTVLIPYTELRAVLDLSGILAPLQNGSTLPELNAATAPDLAAPLPSPMLVTYGRQLDGDAIFFTRAFNMVLVGVAKWRHGDTSVVQAVRDAGMSAILYLDWKAEWLRGENISRGVDQIISTVKAKPGMISGIGVADELNHASNSENLLTPNQMIGYLAATAGRFKTELPGVPIFADIINAQLSCELPQQGSCDITKRACWDACAYQTSQLMVRLYETGHLDGFLLNYPNWFFRSDVGETAMERARALLPEPFILIARTDILSFSEQTYPGTAADAEQQVEAWRRAPLRGGADGVALWVWRKKDDGGGLRTFLDKDGTGNPLWEELVAALETTPR